MLASSKVKPIAKNIKKLPVRRKPRMAKPTEQKSTTTQWHGTKTLSKKEDEKEDHCVVCLEPVEKNDKYFLPCTHYFHRKCIEEWLRHKHVCPTCKRDIYRTDPNDVEIDTVNDSGQDSLVMFLSPVSLSEYGRHGPDMVLIPWIDRLFQLIQAYPSSEFTYAE